MNIEIDIFLIIIHLTRLHLTKYFIALPEDDPAVRDEVEEEADDEPAGEEGDDHGGELPRMEQHAVAAWEHLSEYEQEQGMDQVESERNRSDFRQEVFDARQVPETHQMHQDEQRRSSRERVRAPGELVQLTVEAGLAGQRQVIDADI